MTRAPDGNGGLAGLGLTQIATGPRNAAGMAFDPVGGGLYFQDNGIDTPGNRRVSFSADELNYLASEDIGGAVENFGFSETYVDYATGQIVNPQPGVVNPGAVTGFEDLDDPGDYFHFFDNDLAGTGLPDGLLSTFDSLYVAGLYTNGGISGGSFGPSRIYRITVIPEPGMGLMVGGGWVCW